MAGMTTVPTPHVPPLGVVGGGWRAADLELLPDDGRRYEILDGVLVVSPAPIKRHQRASRRLERLLEDACPHGLEVFDAPLDWKASETTVFQPDLMVVPATGVDEPVGTPLLAVEILSPSTANADRTRKFNVYAEVGVGQYWIVDPGSVGDSGGADVPGRVPSIEVYDLSESGNFELQVRAVGGEQASVAGPVPVSVIPDGLIA